MEVRRKRSGLDNARAYESDQKVLWYDVLDCLFSAVDAARRNTLAFRFAIGAFVLLVLCLTVVLMPRQQEVDPEKYYGRRSGSGDGLDAEVYGPGLYNDTNVDGKFDMEVAARLWEQHVGCASFRKRYAHIMDAFRNTHRWPKNPSLQDPTNPTCDKMKLRHVTVFAIPSPESWLDGNSLEGYYYCPRCGITCQFTFAEVMATHGDAILHVAPSQPHASRQMGDALRVYLDMDRAARSQRGSSEGPWDLQVSWSKAAELQLSFARYWDTIPFGRRHDIQGRKFQDPLVYWHEDDCEDPSLLTPGNQVAAHIPTHSFGRCMSPGNRNTSTAEQQPQEEEGPSEEVVFQETCPTSAIHSTHNHLSHCRSSNYKFELIIDDPSLPNFVSAKLLRTLEAGVVPIYYGAPDIDNFMPPHSFIDGRKFSTPQELLSVVTELHKDPLKYMDYFGWRTCGVHGHFAHVDQLGFRSLPCRLCEQVSAMNGRLYRPY